MEDISKDQMSLARDWVPVEFASTIAVIVVSNRYLEMETWGETSKDMHFRVIQSYIPRDPALLRYYHSIYIFNEYFLHC